MKPPKAWFAARPYRFGDLSDKNMSWCPGNAQRTLVLPEPVTRRSMTASHEKLDHDWCEGFRYRVLRRLLDATVAIAGNLFVGIPRTIAELRPPADTSPAAYVSTLRAELNMRGEMLVDKGEFGVLPVTNPSKRLEHDPQKWNPLLRQEHAIDKVQRLAAPACA
jgi:hypothetical protein